MDNTLQQILKMNINVNHDQNEDDSFLHSANDNDGNQNMILDSINVSEIEPSGSASNNRSGRSGKSVSNHSVDNVMAKLSKLSTSSFTLSAFKDDNDGESGNTNEKLLKSKNSQSDSTMVNDTTNPKFPPLTPQDLMSDNEKHSRQTYNDTMTDHTTKSNNDHLIENIENKLEKTMEIDDNKQNEEEEEEEEEDDDMELDEFNDGYIDRPLQRPNAGFIEIGQQSASSKSNTNTAFRLNYSIYSKTDDNNNSNVDNSNVDNSTMCVGDLEMVREEPTELQSKKNYSMFVGIDSDYTTYNDTNNPSLTVNNSQTMSLQDAFNNFKSISSFKTFLSNTDSLYVNNTNDNNNFKNVFQAKQKSHEQIQIEKRLQKLKEKEKHKKYGKIFSDSTTET